MTGIELKSALSNYSYPLPADKRAGIFALFEAVTGKPKERKCPNCATDAYFELRVLARDYGEKEIPLNMPIQKQMKQQQSTLSIYSIEKPFRVHGDPKVYANWNTTDSEVEMLIRRNPALRHHFSRVDGQDIMTFAQSGKVAKTTANKPDHSVSVDPKPKPIKIKRTSAKSGK